MQKGRVLLLLALFAAAWYALNMTAEVKAVPIKRGLADFPQRLGDYRLSGAFQSSSEELEMLGVDDYIQYNYMNDTGARMNLYVGYYRAVGVTGSYHSPKNCLPGGGWGIADAKQLPLRIAGAKSAIAEMLIKNGGEEQVVLYWYQNRGRIIASEYWEKFWLIKDALFMGRRDGAFIRVMTYATDGRAAAEQRALQFSELVIPALDEFLPGARL
ncbi:MAG: EpsI family protein [Desulfobulbaceae bacterium]|nr:EpsI family protein [Desulfobulbaceae bacterium]